MEPVIASSTRARETHLTADQRATAACFAKLSGWRLRDALDLYEHSQGEAARDAVEAAANAMRGAQ